MYSRPVLYTAAQSPIYIFTVGGVVELDVSVVSIPSEIPPPKISKECIVMTVYRPVGTVVRANVAIEDI